MNGRKLWTTTASSSTDRLTMRAQRMTVAAIVALLGASSLGCSDSASPAGDAGSGEGGTTGADSGTTPAGGGAPCTSAADCRLYGAHCETCTCLALSVDGAAPVCTGKDVSCFVDPCTGKTALCQSGICTVE